MQLNINSSAVVVFTNKLEKLHKSALPVATREALNTAAFDVKKNTMPKEAKVFTQRNPTFFKSTSKVQPAKGFDIKSMKSIVGFMPQSGAKESGGATEDLKQQEDSGTIGHRSFIPLAGARAGGNYNRRVSNKMRLAVIKSKIVDAKKSKARTKAGQFFSSAWHAGKGGIVIGNKMSNGSRMLLRINSVTRIKKTVTTKAGKTYTAGNTVVNSTPIYSLKKNRVVKIKQTKFMQKASLESQKIIEQAYITAAEKQIQRLTK